VVLEEGASSYERGTPVQMLLAKIYLKPFSTVSLCLGN
jgi:hypothetical protein